MHPVLFEIGPVPLRSFGLMVALGFLLGAHLWGRLMRRFGEDPEGDPDRVSAVSVAILVGVIGGGRLMYVLVEVLRYLSSGDAQVHATGHMFLTEPETILFIWQGGLVMYGGFLGAIWLGMRSARKHGLNVLNALDTGLLSGFVGLAIGRIGCLLVGDDHGSVVPEAWRDAPFPIALRVPSAEWFVDHPQSLFPRDLAGEVLWATQPWMTINALCIAAVGFLFLSRRRYAGQASLVMLVHYAITRFAIEAFRGDEIRGLWFGGVSTSQLISVVVALVALALLWRLRGRREDLPGARGPRGAHGSGASA